MFELFKIESYVKVIAFGIRMGSKQSVYTGGKVALATKMWTFQIKILQSY